MKPRGETALVADTTVEHQHAILHVPLLSAYHRNVPNTQRGCGGGQKHGKQQTADKRRLKTSRQQAPEPRTPRANTLTHGKTRARQRATYVHTAKQKAPTAGYPTAYSTAVMSCHVQPGGQTPATGAGSSRRAARPSPATRSRKAAPRRGPPRRPRPTAAPAVGQQHQGPGARNTAHTRQNKKKNTHTHTRVQCLCVCVCFPRPITLWRASRLPMCKHINMLPVGCFDNVFHVA